MGTPLHILLIEDSLADIRIIQRALRDQQVPHELTTIRDGQEAIAYLRQRVTAGAAADPEPDLILLDLNLPGLSGADVLGEIKRDPALRKFPVIILTTSNRPEDVLQTYQIGANTYIQKPEDYDQYRAVVEAIHTYWSDIALLPSRTG